MSLYKSGQIGEALDLAEKTFKDAKILLGIEHPETLYIMNNLAVVYESTGQYGKAEPLHIKGIEISTKILGINHQETLRSINNLAVLYSRMQRFDESIQLHKLVLEKRESLLGLEHPDTVSSLQNLASAYAVTKQITAAKPLFRRVVEARETQMGPDHPLTLETVANLAVLLDNANLNELAEPLYIRAFNARERVLGPLHPDTIVSANNLAYFFMKLERFQEAKPLFKSAINASVQLHGPEHPSTIGAKANLSALLVKSGEFEEALGSFQQMDASLDHWLRLEARSTQAAEMRRQLMAANSVFQDAIYSFSLQYPSTETARFAANATLKWKGRLAQDNTILRRIASETDSNSVVKVIEEIREIERKLSSIAFNSNINFEEKFALIQRLNSAEIELRSVSEEFRQFQSIKNATIDDVSSALPGNALLVEFRIYSPFDFQDDYYDEPSLVAVLIRKDVDPVLVDLGYAHTFFALQALTVDKEIREIEGIPFRHLMHYGFDLLIDPLSEYLDEIETIYIAPDGPLQALPFDAFLNEDKRRLIELYNVRTIQTGRMLVAENKRPDGKGLVAIGGIDFGSVTKSSENSETQPETHALEVMKANDITRQQITRFQQLPHSENEVREIGKIYAKYEPDEPTPIVLTGMDGTETAVKTLATPPRVLHFATHGYYLETGSLEEQPLLQSGITLAGANRALSGALDSHSENGILHALEAQSLNLRGTELVVLSACNTGQGVHDYSEGLEGLPRALQIAGAKYILVALWPVGDQAASEFMKRFYRNWLSQSTSDPALALRKTKLWYVGRSLPAKDWAPFVLIEG